MPSRTKKVKKVSHKIQGPGSYALRIVQKFFPNVTKITDAKKPIQVEVTARDVKRSKKYDHNGCALAVACKDAFKLDGVIIAVKTAYTVVGNEAERFQVPESASREIVSFDRSGIFEPGVYHLDVPVVKLGQHMRPHPEGRTNTGQPPTMRHATNNVRAALGSKAI